jgi:hypothetical protein
MVWSPVIRTAVKVAPVALEVARQLDRQLRPHVLAYQAARDVDGYIARWTAGDGAHWVVFPDRVEPPLRAFPPLTAEERTLVHEQLDRATLRHHSELPEARVRATGSRLAATPRRLTRARRSGD